MNLFSRFKQSLSQTDKVLAAALLICFLFNLRGITVKYNNPDQMAFQPLFNEGKLPFNPGWFDKPPFHTYFNYFLSVLPVSLLGKGFDLTPQTEEILKTVWSRLLTKFMLLGSISLLYRISCRSFGLLPARATAWIAATTAGFIAYSHFLTVDLPVMFWMLLAFTFSHSILFERKMSSYLLAGFFTGIAAATKYNGVAIGITLVGAHVLSFCTVSWRQIPWKALLLDKRLVLGLAMVAVGFIAGNPFAVLDYRSFYYGFLYNYMVTPVYEGQMGYSFIRFFSRMVEILGLPFFFVSAAAFLFALYAAVFGFLQRSFTARPSSNGFTAPKGWIQQATFMLCLSIFIPYFIQFGLFPRLETRFVLPIIPVWILMSGLLWEKLRPSRAVLGLALVPLLGYNLICSYYVGERILDDPRLQSEAWIQENMADGSSVEKDIYSPSWMFMPEVQVEVTVMPFVTGRERLFEKIFPGNTFINGTQEDRRRAEEMIAWYSEDALMKRRPDYIVTDSLYFDRFLRPGIRRDLYPSMVEYFDSLLSEKYAYKIVFDQESKDVLPWVYPKDIDFTHNRLIILFID